MTDTANLGLPFIDGSQAQKHVTHNEALRILDDVIQIGVLDVTLTTPPSTPAEGERHVVATGATGAWAGQANAIAAYEDATWRFLTPKLGWCVWSAADSVLFVFDGAVWRDLRSLPVSLDSLAHLGINETATSPNFLSVKSNASLFNSINVAAGGTGDARIQISKESSTNTASVVFSDAFSGRAEFGLVGSDAFKLKVSNDGSTFVESLVVDQITGNLTLPRGVLLTGVLLPSQITSNQNDYAPSNFSTANVMRISTDASRNITGLAGGGEGRRLYLVNAGSYPAVLKDENASSTAANRFGFGNDLTLATKQGATLIYDGNASRWRQVGGPSSASGAVAGATDSERQNSLLVMIYQSKSLSDIRRLVNIFATGFKTTTDTLRGIDAGNSSNYNTSNSAASGYILPTLSADTYSTAADPTFTTNLGGYGSFGIRQQIAASVYSAVSNGTKVRLTLTGNSSISSVINNVFIGHAGTAPNFDGNQVRVTFSGNNGVTLSSATVVSDTVAFAFDHTKDIVISYDMASGPQGTRGISSGATNYTEYEKSSSNTDAASTTVSGYSTNIGQVLFIDKLEVVTALGTTPQNMTLVTSSQTADTTVSNGRVLIEYDNTASPILNTDLTAEITCDGGAHWTGAALSVVTSYGQSGRKIAETIDQVAGTTGTSFAARIKTLNNKNVPIYGATVTVR